MQRFSPAPSLFWRRLTVVFVGGLLSLVIYSPIQAIVFDDSSSSISITSPTEPVGLLMPVIIKNYPTTIPAISLPLITEVLYNPAGYEPDGEWFELYNAGGLALDLYGYKIGDQSSPGCCEGMLAFPPGAVLQAGQVIVIANNAVVFRSIYGFNPDYEMESSDQAVPVLSRYFSWAARSVELTNTGDELLLLDHSDKVVDALSWGSSTYAFDPSISIVAEGYSLERYPAYQDTDRALDWRRQSFPQPGVVDLTPPTPTPPPPPTPTIPSPVTPTLAPTPFAGKLLLSEFLANPDGSEPDQEWIEIYNADSSDLALTDFKIGDEELQGGVEGMMRFPVGAVLPGGQAAVVAKQGLAFYIKYGFNPDYEISNTSPDVPDMQPYTIWGTSSLDLSNSGDELLLLDGRDELIDSVSYGDSIVYLNPSIPAAPEGSSLERYPADQDHNVATDWRVQPAPNPGSITLPTPVPTSAPTPQPILVINEIHISPDPAAGDANGDSVIHSFEDQFVEIVNLTGSVVDLGGWTLRDGLIKRHDFPTPTLIQDGCAIVIFGGGDPTGDFGGSLVQVASSGTLSLSYPVDILKLLNGDGVTALELSYNSEGILGQSITRNPDISGSSFVPHTSVPAAEGYFSPGTMLDGSPFQGCLISGINWVWNHSRR
jgi:hypothetical protein